MTTHIHNPTFPCSCHIRHAGPDEHIVYCPVHAAAPDLLSALSRFRELTNTLAAALTPEQISEATQALSQHSTQARLTINKAQSL